MKRTGNCMEGEVRVALDHDEGTGKTLYCEMDSGCAGEESEPTICLTTTGMDGFWFVEVKKMRALCDLVEKHHAMGNENWQRDEGKDTTP
jgi:hypothetical protein